jgi:hypothetical protein
MQAILTAVTAAVSSNLGIIMYFKGAKRAYKKGKVMGAVDISCP